jgi:hypothetical protein
MVIAGSREDKEEGEGENRTLNVQRAALNLKPGTRNPNAP